MRDRIVTALGISRDLLRDPEFVAQLQAEIDRGHALHDMDLLAHAERLRRGGDGSVNAVLAGLKHRLGYGSADSNKSRDTDRPDLEACVAEMERVVGRVR